MQALKEEILKRLERDSLLFKSPIHGFAHWQTVESNGLYLASFTGADPLVITFFAYFHDCMRENEWEDPAHGPRGARYARDSGLMESLNPVQRKQFLVACSGHTFGRRARCVTVATCWDADRLDLGRVGVLPDSNYLFSNEAKRIADEEDFQVLEPAW